MLANNDKPILVTIGRGGWTIYYAERPDGSYCRASGYGDETTPGHHGDSVRGAIAQGTPCVDSRTVGYEDICRLAISGPMVAQGRPDAPTAGKGIDGCGYGGFDYAPVQLYIDLYRRYGARCINC